ncbi:MAG: response regulator transcription factor [Oscillospiraceae bacterium]|nr:response regulator transcription factor [Oscillospiraceae bacterium]
MSEENFLVLIVEDDCEMARLNARFLQRNGFLASVAANVAEARSLFGAGEFDLFVLDIDLPDGNGISLCRHFREKTDAPILFLTGKAQTADKVAGLSSGGDYYLTKPYDRDEFLAVAKTLCQRARREKKRLAEALVVSIGPMTLKLVENKAYLRERDIGLTSKEFSVLLLLVQHKNNELSPEGIYESVWGEAMNIDTGLVRKTISQIKRKLDIDEIDEFFISTKYGGGYTFVDE